MSKRYTILNAAKTLATSIVAADTQQDAADDHTGGDTTRVLDWPGWVLRDIVIEAGPTQTHRQVYEAKERYNDLIEKIEANTANRDEFFTLLRILGSYRGPQLLPNFSEYLELTVNDAEIDADGTSSATFTVTKKDIDDADVGSGTETVEIEVSSPCKVSALSIDLVAGTGQFTITSQSGVRGVVWVRVKVSDDSLGRSEPVKLTFE